MRLDNYTIVSIDQDLPAFGATCALLRYWLRPGPDNVHVLAWCFQGQIMTSVMN